MATTRPRLSPAHRAAMHAIHDAKFILKPHIGRLHLDFGCGDGFYSAYLHSACPQSEIIGYDSDCGKIALANRLKAKRGLSFTDSKDYLISGSFDSATLTLVLHEADSSVLETVYRTLLPGGRICVMDYHLKGIGLDRFLELFVTEREQKELVEMGPEKAWQIHTARGLEECVSETRAVGFWTVDSYVLRNRYFLWIGQK
jgi:ubiquinone/menaquinone biosynthesis C-methylase UbiE